MKANIWGKEKKQSDKGEIPGMEMPLKQKGSFTLSLLSMYFPREIIALD